MTPVKPDIQATGSYTLTQASRLLAIDRKTLRRYEAAGLVAVHINQFGKRKYFGRDLINLWNLNY